MTDAHLLWVDLEMTGLDPNKDHIIEVGAIATGMDLSPIADFRAVVRVDEDLMRSRMVGPFWDKNSSTRSDLIAQNHTGRPIAAVEKDLISFVKKSFKDSPLASAPTSISSSASTSSPKPTSSSSKSPLSPNLYLAGNSIHQDRRFIEREMPTLDALLHYRMLDVTAWKIYFENALGLRFTKPENHRAMDDILGSIEEFKWYLSFIRPSHEK